ncbi:hypothetical protein FE257_000589 [Aspergillus nanangensis]|uniref:Uncharacterized protein n=1 Tax=Aspergillus nanangensis TaxID=2582783 RepID=A0AAD4CF13_ASPNN|nr:hypothetical protein FE257_000589 [Aspergillus nanangensis]
MSSYSANRKVRGNPFLLIPPDMDISPIRLVWTDIHPCASGALDELYPNYLNLRDIFLHIVLVVFQVILLLSLAVFLCTFWVFPVIIPVAFMVFSWGITWAILRVLNGPPRTQCRVGVPENNIAAVNDETELWFFINGICTGENWLQSNLTLLANVFRREIVGIHNPTKGLIMDLLECLVQRDLDYKTQDIRQGRAQLRSALRSPTTNKVVLIAHSQGGIEAASIIDWLYGELTNDELLKLEVYTFGNAARHFRNPPVRSGSDETVLQYIEHYANDGDFVANIGVLKFTSLAARYTATNEFSGKVFRRQGSGHLLNMHYLDTMLCGGGQGGFMDAKVPVHEQGSSDGIALKPMKDLSRLFKYKDGRRPEEGGCCED